MEAHPPHVVRLPLLRQAWRDVIFLHWPVDPDRVRHLVPPGTEPDVVDGVTWLGVIGLRVTDGWLGPTPWPPFDEVNLRLYTRDADGEQAVVFRALEAGDPVFAGGSRTVLNLPYCWSASRCERTGRRVTYATRRRLPPAGDASLRFAVEYDAPLADPSPLEVWFTARWFMHQRWCAGTLRGPISHEPWPLHAARLLDWYDGGLLAAAGLPSCPDPPASVLYAPSVSARFGPPARVGSAAAHR